MVQQIDDLRQRSIVIEQIRDCAQQIAKQISWPWLCTDIEDNPIEMYHQAKKV